MPHCLQQYSMAYRDKAHTEQKGDPEGISASHEQQEGGYKTSRNRFVSVGMALTIEPLCKRLSVWIMPSYCCSCVSSAHLREIYDLDTVYWNDAPRIPINITKSPLMNDPAPSPYFQVRRDDG